MSVSLTKVSKDHASERIQTHLIDKRGRIIELHVEHRQAVPAESMGEHFTKLIRTNYTLDVFLVVTKNAKGDDVLEARIGNPADKTGVYGEAKPLTTLVQITPDPREFR